MPEPALRIVFHLVFACWQCLTNLNAKLSPGADLLMLRPALQNTEGDLRDGTFRKSRCHENHKIPSQEDFSASLLVHKFSEHQEKRRRRPQNYNGQLKSQRNKVCH